MDCIFCKIIAGEIPSRTVYEDDQVLAFHDIEPKAPVHVLVIPKTHIPGAGAVTQQNSGLVAHVFEVLPQIARELGVEKRAPEGFRTVARLLGVAPEQCIFFDDSPVACKGAKIAGMQVVACKDPLFASCREEMAQFCDYYLDSFENFTL